MVKGISNTYLHTSVSMYVTSPATWISNKMNDIETSNPVGSMPIAWYPKLNIGADGMIATSNEIGG